MNIIYDQETDTPRIEFLDEPSHATNHNGIVIRRTSNGQVTTIEIQNSSGMIPIEAFNHISLDLPPRSKEAIEEYKPKKQDHS